MEIFRAEDARMNRRETTLDEEIWRANIFIKEVSKSRNRTYFDILLTENELVEEFKKKFEEAGYQVEITSKRDNYTSFEISWE